MDKKVDLPKEIEDEALDIKRAFEEVYATEAGKIVFHYTMKKCIEDMGVSHDPYISIFNQGKQSIFKYMLDMTNLDHEFYLKMVEKDFKEWTRQAAYQQ